MFVIWLVSTVILISLLCLQVICGILYHLIFVMFVWSYWMVVFTPPGEHPLTANSWTLMGIYFFLKASVADPDPTIGLYRKLSSTL